MIACPSGGSVTTLGMRTGILWAVLASAASGRGLYVDKEGIEVELITPLQSPMSADSLRHFLHSNGLEPRDLARLHFDRLQSPTDLLLLSKEFFEADLTDEQVGEIANNDKINAILTGRYEPPEGCTRGEWSLIKAKIGLLSKRLGVLAREEMGVKFDRLLGRMKESMYGFLDPVSVLLSPAFKATPKGYARLFGMSIKTAKKSSKMGGRLISAFKRTVRDMAHVSGEALLGAVANIAFALLECGVPLPPFVTDRIARVVVGITNKSAMVRNTEVQARASVEKLRFTALSKSKKASAAFPHNIRQHIEVVSQQAKEMQGDADHLLDSLLHSKPSAAFYQEFLRSVCSLVIRAHAVNRIISDNGLLHEAAGKDSREQLELTLLEERLTEKLTLLTRLGQAVQSATAQSHQKDSSESQEIFSQVTLSLLVYILGRMAKTAEGITADAAAWLADSAVSGAEKGGSRKHLCPEEEEEEPSVSDEDADDEFDEETMTRQIVDAANLIADRALVPKAQ